MKQHIRRSGTNPCFSFLIYDNLYKKESFLLFLGDDMTISKKNITYTDVLGEAWLTLKKNPVIFSPILYVIGAIIALVLFGLLFSWISGSSVFLSALFDIILIISILFIFVHIAATQMCIISRLALEKKVRFREAIVSAKEFMPKIVIIILLIILALIPALLVMVVFALPLVLMMANPSSANVVIGSISLILSFIAGLLIFLLFKAWTIFVFPKLLYEKKKPKTILAESWHLMWKYDRKNVWITFFIVFAISIGINIIFAAINRMVNPTVSMDMTLTTSQIIVQSLSLIASIIIGLWLNVFVYKVYAKRHNVKR